MPTDRKRVVVTGANRGLGLEVARLLARQGYNVLLTARDAKAGALAAQTISDEGLVQCRPLDVADAVSRQAFVSFVAQEFGPLDVLVNNAGISQQGFNADVARETLAVNFFGPLELTQSLFPHLSRNANVVMVSSGMGELAGLDAGLRARFEDPALTISELSALVASFLKAVADGRHAKLGWPSSAYRVSKIALNALTRIFARDQQARQMHINAVCPGWVRTEMGGSYAPRSVEEGAKSIVWGATLAESGPTGGFFRDGQRVAF